MPWPDYPARLRCYVLGRCADARRIERAGVSRTMLVTGRSAMNEQMTVTDRITPKEFRESDGVQDWRVLGDGANAYFRTGSLAAGARLVEAISNVPGVEDHHPDIDVRHD